MGKYCDSCFGGYLVVEILKSYSPDIRVLRYVPASVVDFSGLFEKKIQYADSVKIKLQ